MSKATLEEHRVRQTISVNNNSFATDTNKHPRIRKGRPVEKWVLVVGSISKLEVYNAENGGVIIRGSEFKAYESAQRMRSGTKKTIRAIPFSSAFYAL